jgi:NAD(P)-dependent dehydrogenase (short-subunit alcohol dehydrogenase family)
LSRVAGKVALVTGGSRGVGFAIAERLADEGARLALVARNDGDLRLAADRLGGVAFRCDVADPNAVGVELKHAVEERLGPPQILVNNAGTYAPMALVVESDPHEWMGAVGVNLFGPYLTCHAFAPAMIEAGWGRIVNVTSIASVVPPVPLCSSYSASKAALNYLTRSLAVELAGTGVTANVIHPGEVQTEMWRYIAATAESSGPEGKEHREWAHAVAGSGGDPPGKAAELVLDCVEDESINGRFLWIEDGLYGSVPTW